MVVMLRVVGGLMLIAFACLLVVVDWRMGRS